MKYLHAKGVGCSRLEENRKSCSRIDLSKERKRVLIVSSCNNIVGEASSHGHALLLVDQKRVLLHFDVLLQSLFVPQ